MDLGRAESPLILKEVPQEGSQSSLRQRCAYSIFDPAADAEFHVQDGDLRVELEPGQLRYDQSLPTNEEDNHWHFESTSCISGGVDRENMADRSGLEGSVLTPDSHDADHGEILRGRSPMRIISPSSRPRRSDISEGHRNRRTSVQKCGRHALDIRPSEDCDFAETVLELPWVDVSGALNHTADGWALTDRFSECSSDSSTSLGYVRPFAFSRHRDTFDRMTGYQAAPPQIPSSIWEGILQHLSHEDLLRLRLTSRAWYSALPSPRFSVSYRLPVEIVQEIYHYLAPQDFNAARHTCKVWFAAALDRNLLALMLRRGGWLAAAEADLQTLWHQPTQSRTTKVQFMDGTGSDAHTKFGTETWLMSKRLATECSMSKYWKGLSLRSMPGAEIMSPCASIDLTALLFSAKHPNLASFKRFTVSACSRFVLVSKDCVVYVYSLSNTEDTLQAVTSIRCPNEVIAVSMDTSTQRYAIAVLLEGRVGLVCDIQNTIPRPSSDSPKARRRISFSDVFGTDSDFDVRVTREHTTTKMGPRLFKRSPQSRLLASRTAPPGSETCVTKLLHEPLIESVFPVESGQRSIYRNLCAVDDPPISVAICPQRRCVAFGCRLGIELHWVDALSGQDLHRWFPLAAPSDHLYFLPPRKDIDSTKKLRLVSSAAGPESDVSNDQSGTNRMWHAYGPRSHSMAQLFFGNIPTIEELRVNDPRADRSHLSDHGIVRAFDCDHFRAVPLSDGAHMLFIDPVTGYLCLGSDAPLGSPTRLLRKVVCIPPEIPEWRSKLLAYTAGDDLRWGVRIVAAYASGQIVLFSVPLDLFKSLNDPSAFSTSSRMANSDPDMDSFMEHVRDYVNAANSDFDSSLESPESSFATRSARIEGVEIGKLDNVVDMSVDCSNGGLKIWAFSSDGYASVWKLCSQRLEDRTILRTVINSDGTVKLLGDFDWEGDAVMTDQVEWQVNQEADGLSGSLDCPTQPGSPTNRGVASLSASTPDQQEPAVVEGEDGNPSQFANWLFDFD